MIISRDLGHSGGVVNYVRLLIQNLDDKKFQIRHFKQGRNPDNNEGIFLPLIIILQFFSFNKILKNDRPDVVHVNPSLGWIAIIRDSIYILIAYLHGIPIICFMRGWDTSISRRFSRNIIFSIPFRILFNLPKLILTLASQHKSDLQALGIPSNKIKLTTTMVNAKIFGKKKKDFSHDINILYCGNLIRKKGIFELVRTIPRILIEFPDTQFTFLGKGIEFDAINLLIEKLNLSNNVKLLGYMSGREKIIAFQNSHVLILPSYTEGFPNVYCEAMAAGLPFIGTDVGGLTDVVEDGIQGFLLKSVPPDPTEICDVVVELMRHPNLMESISKNNYTEADEKYDVSVKCKEIGGYYLEIAS